MICPKCRTENVEGAKFCAGCGTSLEQGKACPKCGAINPPGAAFCAVCGASLEQGSTCPKCSAINPPEAVFCTGCGARLAVEAPAPPPAAPVRPAVAPAPPPTTAKPALSVSQEKSPWEWHTLFAVSILGSCAAVGILAGINWRRMGIQERMWPTIIAAVILYIGSWIGLWFVPWPGGFFSTIFGALLFLFGVFFAVGLAVATALWLWQRGTYQAWKQQHPQAQRAGWQIPVIVIVALIIVFVVVIMILGLAGS